ncbi:bifunctional Phosphatidylinositol-glycan biosynthesis class X protein/Glycosylphosphatidylinositol-mannosyltransferase I [Babesia duncani]|uniref:Bifunctional Phosphatidylinositol-glycan biosynthesis class X protein/Glycosylphosphatidylinositol-mannosyltransferase I n=1 Tax=Babesia duncani TaxID=323732 RepID=A0AAD9PI86_9APIC|nr:bifunctional Phosphatidylinositol-glycan biosynthesis class X protein/Glycosylphosphatidylinositol-mannosyltransferase I [Babesia duncani]
MNNARLIYFLGVLTSCVIFPISINARRIFAAFEVEESCTPGFHEAIDFNTSALYFAYYNTNHESNVWFNGYSHLNFDVLDNAPSGLSIVTRNEKNESKSESGHLVHSIEGWCYVLSLATVYSKVLSHDPSQATNVATLFYKRCLELNNQVSSEATEGYRKLLSRGFKLISVEDAYMFEKWSIMCPKPSLIDDDKLAEHVSICKTLNSVKKRHLQLLFYKHRQCFMNDFADYEVEPYSLVHKKFLTTPRALFHKYELCKTLLGKWSIQHMPKVAQIDLGLDGLMRTFVTSLLKEGKCTNYPLILHYLNHDWRLHYITASFEKSQGMKLKVGLSFDRDPKTIGSLNVFNYYTNGFTMLTRSLSTPYRTFYPPLTHSFHYDDIKGTGQHRHMDIVVELDARVLRWLTFPDGRCYIKMTQVLDTSVFLDIYELRNTFDIIEEEKLSAIQTSALHVYDQKAYVTLKTLRIRFSNIEDPQVTSSPVIYSGYVALDTEILKYDKLVIKYQLPIHTRYVHMNKHISPELSGLDTNTTLPRFTASYTSAFISEPFVYIYMPHDTRIVGTPEYEYLLFLKDTSFATFASQFLPEKEFGDKGFWQRCYISRRGVNLNVVDPCNIKSHDTGIGSTTFSFTNYKCASKNKVDIQDSRCYLTFPIPVSNQEYFGLVSIVTALTVFGATLVTMKITYMACRQLSIRKNV